MLRLKPKVRFKKITEEHIYMFKVLTIVSTYFKKDMFLTSGNDGRHREGSKHYEDRAVDIRARHLTVDQTIELMTRVNKLKTKENIINVFYQFEWKEKIGDEWSKYKTNVTKPLWQKTIEKYHKSTNKTKQCHIHAEW